MALPFTIEQFINVLKIYNERVFPAQILLFLLGVFIIYAIYKKKSYSSRLAIFAISFFWLWAGIVYHLFHFTEINKAAYIFGILFVIEAIILLMLAIKNKIELNKIELSKIFSNIKKSYKLVIGLFFLLYALIIYPLLNFVFGHTWPYMPTFGLPCPTVIFTFGILLLAKKLPKYVIIIPLIWALIGLSAAINLHVWEDLMLVISGIVGSLIILFSKK